MKKMLLGLGLVSLSGSSFAAIDAGVTTAFTTLNADIATIGSLILAAAVAAVAFKWLKGTIFS